MPQHKSAEKRVRQNEKRRLRNRYHKSRMRSMIKNLEGVEDAGEARSLLNEVKSYLDRLATKRIISKNRAAHQKSRLEQIVSNR
jgi:small subunit ribosomal protein S20